MIDSPSPRLTVVIPVFNESATIEELLRRVEAVPIHKEIIVVDDGSTDGTRELLETFVASKSSAAGELATPSTRPARDCPCLVRVILQPRNLGKGAALRRGFHEARGEFVIVQDADLEYDPKDYPRLLEPIERGEADVVYGSRFLGGPHRVLFFWHAVGNKFLTILSNVFTNLNLSDVWTCYKAFRREILQGITLRENRFGFEPEITAKVARGRWRLFEIPISYYGRTYAQGKKITWKDGFRALICVVRYRLFD